MALRTYRAKRNLKTTPEPAGGTPEGDALHFVVQKHAATRLHYDFRLELDGVLLSWAVPKGPSMNPGDKRLAMMVEDHPLDYRLFEGIIPKGNYGAGRVIVWDEGTYTDYEQSPTPAAARKLLKAGLAKGDLKFNLHGRKLRGAFVLAKINSDDDNAWLLIKKADEFASEDDVTKLDKSVLSGRTLEQLGPEKFELSGAPKAKQPESVAPMLASLAAAPFDQPDWLYEIKWDGYRILAHLQDGQVSLRSRGGQDYTDVFEPIAQQLRELRVDCILDGEVVVLDKSGRSDFGALQNYQRTGQGELYYYVFDVPYADGHNLCPLPLTRRKQIASQIIAPLDGVRLSDHITQNGSKFFELVKERGLEGVMAKAASSPYAPGKRSRDWLKIRTHLRQEAVIGGFTAPRGSRHRLGALVLGVYDDNQQLKYIGHTGTGMDDRTLEMLHSKLSPLEQPKSPFDTPPQTNAPAHWVEPKLAAEIQFTNWTPDGRMRHPVFLGLRSDKPPKTIAHELPVSPPTQPPKAEITHADKIFWPTERYTKGNLADYYASVAATILPYLKDRPEALNRYPNGISGKSFFQKNLETHPGWISTTPIYSESNGQDIQWLVCNNPETLMYMVNLGCIELNPWLARTGSLEHPDFCLIDLDAKTSPFEHVIEVAKECHKLLKSIDVPSFPKTSGKTGLHICIPLGAKYTFEQSRQFAEILARRINRELPDLTSVDRKPDKRKNKIYLDYLQNRKGQTMAAPYCVRPVPGATVSTPLKWSEVRKGLDPTKFTIKTTPARQAKVGDLWSGLLGDSIDMSAALDRLK
jgi:bifunctional non-homologous end joining protein LigD